MKSQVPLVTVIGSWWGVFFASVMAVLTGALMAGSELALAPVPVVERPWGETTGIVFYHGGNDGGSWQQKLGLFLGSGPREVEMTEGELNRFAGRVFENGASSTFKGVTLKPSIALVGGRAQLGLVATVDGLSSPMAFQARGTFVRGSEGVTFVPAQSYLGTLPLPNSLAGRLVNGFFARAFSSAEAEPFRRAWVELDSVSVQSSELIFRWK
jgi:hypothetical protein